VVFSFPFLFLYLAIVDKSVNILLILKKGKKVANQFGDRIRQLREKQNLLLRQVAPQLEIDTPQLSKIERGERNAKREQVTLLSKIFNVPEDDLLSLWLADKVYEVVKDEDVALKAIEVAEDEVKKIKRKKLK